MPTQTRPPPSSSHQTPMSRNENDPRIPGGQTMNYSTSFIARVSETTVENNTSNEYEKLIVLKKSNLASFLVMRNIRKASAEAESRHRSGKVSEYPINRCISITPSWKEVQEQGSMAIQFEKVDLASSDPRGDRRYNRGKHPTPKVSRTRVMTVFIRNWTIESSPHVHEIWELCHGFAVEYNQTRKNERPTAASRRKTGMASTIIDERIRRRERNRVTQDPRLPMSHSRAAMARMTQGRKMMAALAKKDDAKPRSSYTSLYGAAGRTSFSKSLIGSPNLSGFDVKQRTAQKGSRETDKRIVKTLEERISDVARKGRSVFSGTPVQVENARARVSPPSVNQGKCASSSHVPTVSNMSSLHSDKKRSSSDVLIVSDWSSPPSTNNRPSADVPNISSSLSPPSNKKRPGETQSGEDVQVKRKRNMSDQLLEHFESSQQVVGRKRLRPFVSDTIAAAGIENEGNTCYLSAVVQALMSDSRLISALRKRFLPEMELSFSSALITLENDRDCSTTLKAGNIRNAISKHFPVFSSSNQQDAHEFLLNCLDVMTRECTMRNFRDSPTHTLYSLVQERKITCVSCGHARSPRKEIMRGLSLDIPEKGSDCVRQNTGRDLSVEDLLARFFAPQDVDLNCEKCSGKKAKSESKIALAPRVLLLHIKRFGVRPGGESGVTLEKITDAVHIPHRLSLNSVLTDRAIPAHCIEDPPKSNALLEENKIATFGNSLDSLKPGSEAEGIDTHATAKAGSAGASGQAKKSGSNSNAESGTASTARNIDFAQRFRIHAKESRDKQPYGAEIDMHESNNGTGQKVNRRLLFEDDDMLEDDIILSPVPSERTLANAPVNPEYVKEIAALGLPKQEAEDLLRAANFDRTAAMGLALDRRNEAKESPADLDGDLIQCVSAMQQKSTASNGTPIANYKLGAVIRHLSKSIKSGHYVADILQPNGTWYCYNDSNVFEMVDQSIQDREGYLCWYMLSD